MAALIIVLAFLALFVALGVASALGRTPDTRDPQWSMGRMLNSGR